MTGPRPKRPHFKPKPAFTRKSRRDPGEPVQLFGLHAVEAALSNPNRPVLRLRATPNASRRLEQALRDHGVKPETVTPKELDRLLGPDTVHQGVLLETAPLPQPELDALSPNALVLVLDQVTDPHNVGAVLRSAAAFGGNALIMTARHSPPLSGALAKAASGALEQVNVILVRNLTQTMDALGEMGFLRIGLTGDASAPLELETFSLPLALIFGAEGKGLRQSTREACDRLCRISTRGPLGSLNVSNAVAVSLHWVGTALERSEKR
jgi:23S rRNA (guanosine2251-2'-O)-methyltransferase